MTFRSLQLALLWALGIMCFLVSSSTAIAQSPRTADVVRKEIHEYEKLLETMQKDHEDLERQRGAALNTVIRARRSYPVMPLGWNDFSICPDVNSHAGSALIHYQSHSEVSEQNLMAGKQRISRLRKELTDLLAAPPESTIRPSGGSTPIAKSPPKATTTQPPAQTTSTPPKKDMNCLCRCSCAAAGFNVNNVRCQYTTLPLRHVNPNGQVSDSCMTPSEGPCVCQGHVCRRARLVSSGACADACAK